MALLFAWGFAAGAVLTGVVFWLRPETSPILMRPDLPPVLDLAYATLEGLQWGPRLFANSQPLSSLLALSAGWLLHRFASVRV